MCTMGWYISAWQCCYLAIKSVIYDQNKVNKGNKSVYAYILKCHKRFGHSLRRWPLPKFSHSSSLKGLKTWAFVAQMVLYVVVDIQGTSSSRNTHESQCSSLKVATTPINVGLTLLVNDYCKQNFTSELPLKT